MSKNPNIEVIEPTDRDNAEYFQFVGVTEGGAKFTVQMLGNDRSHAYDRLNSQTERSVSFPNLIEH